MGPDPGRLEGKRIIVTAGGTREYLDPVRYITNASSGKLALAVVEAIIAQGGAVELVDTGIEVSAAVSAKISGRHAVFTAFDMLTVLSKLLPGADGLVMLAAVADYSPVAYSTTKRKKDGGIWVVELSETPDILATMAHQRKAGQLFAGVSLEDADWLARSVNKAAKKSVEVLLAVELGVKLPVGDQDINCALVGGSGAISAAKRRSKPEAAAMLVDWICAWFEQ